MVGVARSMCVCGCWGGGGGGGWWGQSPKEKILIFCFFENVFYLLGNVILARRKLNQNLY